MREKRQYTRITLEVPAILTLVQVEAYHTGAIANISMGGCFFPADETLPLGESCDVTITVGEGIETEEVTLTGQIIRSDSAGAGIKFIDLSSQNRHQLEKIIAQNTGNQQTTVH